VRLSSRPVHILPSGPDQVAFQVPWDAPEDIGRIELDLAVESRSPFQSAFNYWAVVAVQAYAPQLYLEGFRVAALHQDFSGPISPERPARPGEIIHAYGSGFGPVLPQPELGEAAKSNPLSSTTSPVVCAVSQRSDSYPAQVLFAGLAPGWISLYQIDVRLPETLDSSEAHLNCSIQDQIGWSGILPVAAGR
jgi:uncharacterized protein (TIGR03437 family)